MPRTTGPPRRGPGPCNLRDLFANRPYRHDVLLRLAAVAICLAVPSTAAASPRAVTVCSHHATLYETPGGAIVGVVHRGDDVYVLRRGSDGRWWRVRARFGTKGGRRSSAIFREDRGAPSRSCSARTTAAATPSC